MSHLSEQKEREKSSFSIPMPDPNPLKKNKRDIFAFDSNLFSSKKL
jgi:hypothetical protein